MYSVSNDYLTAIATNARAAKLRGTVEGISFTGSDVLQDTFSVRNQFCSATAIEIGGVYIGECDLTFSNAFAAGMNIRGSWRGAVIAPEIGIELADGTFEYVPLGVFTIDEAKWTDSGLKVVAYDNMSKLDKLLNINTSIGKPYNLINLACIDAGVTLGMTEQEVDALPNGLEILQFPGDSVIEKDRDLVAMCAAVCGCFATMNRDGELVLVRLPDDTPVLSISANLRYSTSFSDFTSYYSELVVGNVSDGTSSYYLNNNLGGLSMNIGANPLMQQELDATRDRVRQELCDAIEDFRGVPFSATILPNPALDLGDVIQFTGGFGNGSIGCVMSFVHKLSSTTIEGYGENPAASGAQSELSKQVTSQAKKESENGLTYYTFTNSGEIEINDYEQTTLIDVEFAVNSPTTVMMFHELKMLNQFVDDTQTVTLYFYHGDDLINYQPADTYSEDDEYHFFPSFYTLLNVQNGVTQRWRVKAQTSSGTATIDIGDIHATLVGQKMVAEDAFKGTIKIEDEFTPVKRGRVISSLTDNMSPRQNPIISGLAPVTNARTTVDGNDRTVIGGDTRTIIQED